ncbi:MAG: ATP-binding cassette domain-containing protein [Bacteroidota bacterium]
MEQIKINNLEPVPLRGLFSDSAVWNQEVTLKKGERTLITAASGRGKSTFIHLLIGIRTDYTGTIQYDGQPTTALTPEQWATIRSSQCAAVFQDLRLFLDLSVRENVLLKNALHQHKTETAIQEAVQQLGMGNFWETPVATLSYGQRQRVAIVRAICQPFDFLMLDEPFSHLDLENSRKAIELILEECSAQKAGLILCSHESDYGMAFDRKLNL